MQNKVYYTMLYIHTHIMYIYTKKGILDNDIIEHNKVVLGRFWLDVKSIKIINKICGVTHWLFYLLHGKFEEVP